MKKKVIVLFLAVNMMLGLVACNKGVEPEEGLEGAVTSTEATEEASKEIYGEAKAVMQVTMEGKQYDLAQDFKTVVGQMVQDGFEVQNDIYLKAYDENGEMVDLVSGAAADRNVIYAYEMSQSAQISPVRRRNICLQKVGDFSTVDGIGATSTGEELKGLQGYLVSEADGHVSSFILYVDGKLVDLEAYRETYDNWVKDVNKLGASEAYNKYLYDARLYYKSIVMNETVMRDDASVSELLEETGFTEQMLLTFAAMDAGQKLEKEEVGSYALVTYSYREEIGVKVEYTYYYLDKEATQYDKKMRDEFDKNK